MRECAIYRVLLRGKPLDARTGRRLATATVCVCVCHFYNKHPETTNRFWLMNVVREWACWTQAHMSHCLVRIPVAPNISFRERTRKRVNHTHELAKHKFEHSSNSSVPNGAYSAYNTLCPIGRDGTSLRIGAQIFRFRMSRVEETHRLRWTRRLLQGRERTNNFPSVQIEMKKKKKKENRKYCRTRTCAIHTRDVFLVFFFIHSSSLSVFAHCSMAPHRITNNNIMCFFTKVLCFFLLSYFPYFALLVRCGAPEHSIILSVVANTTHRLLFRVCIKVVLSLPIRSIFFLLVGLLRLADRQSVVCSLIPHTLFVPTNLILFHM